jgi:hypothetical protein
MNQDAMRRANVFGEIADAPAGRSERALVPAVEKRYSFNLMKYEYGEASVESGIITDFVLRKRATDDIFSKFNLMSGKLSELGRRRLGRFIFIDTAKFGLSPARTNIFASWGTYSSRRAMEKVSEVPGGCVENGLCLVSQNRPTGYLLNVTNDVKIYRKDYSALYRTPVLWQTAMFRALSLEDPRFYLASPCFGFAKILKNGNTVYVTVEKCDAGDAANYCYADQDYIWGRAPAGSSDALAGDTPSIAVYTAIWTGTFVPCEAGTIPAVIVTFGSTTAATTAQCMRLASYTTMAAITARSVEEASTTTGDMRLDSNLPENKLWGYWNFYKASDICDLADMIGSMGGSAAAKQAAKKGVKEVTTKAATNVGKYAGDLCIIPQVVGDASLAWPKVTAVWDILGKNKPLTAEIIRENERFRVSNITEYKVVTIFVITIIPNMINPSLAIILWSFLSILSPL